MIELEKWKKAGEKTSEVLAHAKRITKRGMPLLEIAEKVEEYAEKQGLKFAFPINLSINEVAAHYCPSIDDKKVAEGLLKIDLGIAIDGCSGDQAITIDLTEDGRHREMMKANEEALKNAIKNFKEGIEINKTGKIISEAIESKNFMEIRNLSGHEITPYLLHSGTTIPNFDNGNSKTLKEGVYAIEPFATYGDGWVKDGGHSNIFMLREKRPVRGNAQKILKFIEEEYKTLPFASRWILKKFGKNASISLSQLERQGILHHFPQLVEKSGKAVSQFEHTLLVLKDKTILLTRDV